jgi:phage FluMu protein Com
MENLFCVNCSLPLEMMNASVHYLGLHFTVKVPKCPGCGQIYIPEELVDGKISQVEQLLEEK